MPQLFRIGQYTIFFWSNENNEPVHIHVAIKNPSANSTKIWLGCIIANNISRIPQRDLNHLLKIIQTEHNIICDKWKDFFDTDDIKFYC